MSVMGVSVAPRAQRQKEGLLGLSLRAPGDSERIGRGSWPSLEKLGERRGYLEDEVGLGIRGKVMGTGRGQV